MPPLDLSVFAKPADLAAVWPMIVVSIAGVVVLLADLFPLPNRNGVLATLSLIGLGVACAMTANMGFAGRTEVYSGTLVRDGLGTFIGLVILAGSALAVLLSSSYLPSATTFLGEYYSLVLFSTVGMQIMGQANDLISVFVGIEILSLGLYVLAGFFRTAHRSIEAALKYFLLGSFAAAFMLYGIALLYGAVGSTSITAVRGALLGVTSSTSPLLFAGLVLLLIGLAFKAGVVPFHMWVPDVYEGSPTAVTAYMSAAPKAAALAVLLRVFIGDVAMLAQVWVNVFLVLGILTMTLGNVVALVQDNVKRMLAYSGIAHIGYMFVAIATFSEAGAMAILYYLAVYTLMNMGAFAVVVLLNRRGRYEYLSDYAGLASRHPFIAAALALFMISLAGIPPAAGFLAKLYLFQSLIQAGLIPVAIVAVLNSVVSVYYYLRLVVLSYMREAEVEVPWPGLAFGAIVAIALTAAAVVFLGIQPGHVVDLARMSAQPLVAQ